MQISTGFYYHISDTYFSDVNEPFLMSNKENGGYRPHYLAIQDANNSNIYWMVPVSSKYDKYKKIHDQQVQKYKKCTKIVLGKCAGWDAAYLIQNAFPITTDYFDHIHTSHGQPLKMHASTGKLVEQSLALSLNLHKRGINLFFADIDKLYKLMENHLSTVELREQISQGLSDIANGDTRPASDAINSIKEHRTNNKPETEE